MNIDAPAAAAAPIVTSAGNIASSGSCMIRTKPTIAITTKAP